MGDFNNDEHNPSYFQVSPDYDFNTTDFNINDPAAMYLNTDIGASGPNETSINDPALNFLEEFGQSQDFPSFANFPNSPVENFSAPSGPYPTRLQKPSNFVNRSPTQTSPTSPDSTTKNTTSNKRSSITESKPTSNAGDDAKEDLSISAEEDKRRRNTAASARFRVKKKQREQAMEKLAKEMTEKVGALDARVKELEKENRLLKGLLTEKAGKVDVSDNEAGTTSSSKKMKSESS